MFKVHLHIASTSYLTFPQHTHHLQYILNFNRITIQTQTQKKTKIINPSLLSISPFSSQNPATNLTMPGNKLQVTLTDVTRNNIGQVKVLNKAVLPVQYSEQYYQDTVSNWPRDNIFCKLAYHNEYLVGAINARRETYRVEEPLVKVKHLLPGDAIPTPTERKKEPVVDEAGNPLAYRLYITTLSVLPAYQNGQIGTTLLTEVLKAADAQHADLNEVYVHVHVGNARAIEFYKRFGFEEVSTVAGYYKNDVVSPPDALVLARKITPPVVEDAKAD